MQTSNTLRLSPYSHFHTYLQTRNIIKYISTSRNKSSNQTPHTRVHKHDPKRTHHSRNISRKNQSLHDNYTLHFLNPNAATHYTYTYTLPYIYAKTKPRAKQSLWPLSPGSKRDIYRGRGRASASAFRTPRGLTDRDLGCPLSLYIFTMYVHAYIYTCSIQRRDDRVARLIFAYIYIAGGRQRNR